MHKLKIGIPISFDYNPLAGGSYSYTKQLVKAIDTYEFKNNVEIVFLNFEKKDIKTQKPLITFHPFSTYTFRDLIRKTSIQLLKQLPFNLFKGLLKQQEERHSDARNKKIKAVLDENQVKVLFYLNPDGNTYNFPFLTIYWDIGHISTFMFPEFLEDFETRTEYYKNILPKALIIITETEFGKEELIKYTNINPDRIEVMPIFPGEVIHENIPLEVQQETLRNSNLAFKQFFLYPAQFWAHKNHTLLIDAFEEVLKKHPELKLIFTGSDKGNLTYIQNYIKNKNLDNHIKTLGFVDNSDLFTYYKNAIALVMPTYLGPSNMPPLEAAFLNCPILISNIKGHRELLGEYPRYFEPWDMNALVEEMLNQIEEKNSRIFQNGNNFNINAALTALEHIFSKAAIIRKNWT
ncbi:glycosyltransferase family 4 protein [Pedobacter polaris]|uniref:Glycosyltransferase family 4 protein n=1 Tax=Pedobacter polaris TaxID=2571273 RepID=A0A4U1CLM7_9SPHI|nr:glycosyltransferase family 1 protein [Pedobacter polaris]TKC08187.1 glycosyltransferase family 4 protein [Pedobacter polaris]